MGAAGNELDGGIENHLGCRAEKSRQQWLYLRQLCCETILLIPVQEGAHILTEWHEPGRRRRWISLVVQDQIGDTADERSGHDIVFAIVEQKVSGVVEVELLLERGDGDLVRVDQHRVLVRPAAFGIGHEHSAEYIQAQLSTPFSDGLDYVQIPAMILGILPATEGGNGDIAVDQGQLVFRHGLGVGPVIPSA